MPPPPCGGKQAPATTYFFYGARRALEQKDHSDVGATYNNMASVLRQQGKLDAAMEMYEKALGIQR